MKPEMAAVARTAMPEFTAKLSALTDPSRVCPHCSEIMQEQRCKVICQKCGFYLSCSDFY